MPILSEKTLTPEEEELRRKKASLAELEAQLADREQAVEESRASGRNLLKDLAGSVSV